MRKFLPHISLITIILLAVGFFALPERTHAFSLLDVATNAADAIYGLLARLLLAVITLLSWILYLLGAIMDSALNMSLTRDLYVSDAIGLAWSVIRDIANMFFIFILIYEGIRTVLNLGNLVSVRKTITGVIVAALFLNFSLFITRVLIDTSNVAAVWFMQGITRIGGNDSVSYSIVSTLGMEKMLTKYKDFDDKDTNFNLATFQTFALLIILMCVTIYVLFNVVFLIIGRIVAFIFLLITSPLGFAGTIVPVKMVGDYAQKWWKELNNQIMMLPAFFLMTYLTLFIVDRIQGLLLKNALDTAKSDPAVYITFIIVIMMLLKALEVAKEYSGEMGNAIAGLAKNATTFVGGAALVGTVGRLANAAKNSEFLQNAAAKGGIGGIASRGLMMGANATANSSFGTKSAYGGVLKATGMDKTALKDQFKGVDKGYAGKVEQEVKDEEAFAKLLGKDKRGAENRQTYSETLKNSLWSRTAGRVYGSRAGDEGASKKIGKAAGSELKKEKAKEAKEKKAAVDKVIKERNAEIAGIEAQIAAEQSKMGPADRMEQDQIEKRIAALRKKQEEIREQVSGEENKKKGYDEEIEAGKEVEQAERDEKISGLSSKLDKSSEKGEAKEEKAPEPKKE